MKKVAIIGAGISGLFIANLFKRNSNYQITIYDKNKTINLESGYGIQLSINSVKLLNKIEFNRFQNDKKFNPKKINFYSHKSLNKICDLDISDFNYEDCKYTTLKRSDLINFLKKDLENHIKTSHNISKIDQDNQIIRLTFENNETFDCDYLIISDGVFSNTKSVVENENIQPIYNGSLAIRTLIKTTQDFPYDKKNISLIMLKNAHIVIYPINKKDELNLVCIIRQKFLKKIDLNLLIKKEIFSQNKNLENLFGNHLESWPVYVTKKPHRSVYENSFYLGDAFYTFSPTMAQGASQSIESAYELFNLLSKDTKDLQNVYFKKRLERIRLVNNRSRLNYYSFHLSNPLMVTARNFLLKKLTKSEKFLNSYLGNIYQRI